MTVAVAWIRKVNNCEELIFISDSRLSGPHTWDECPKLTTLPGNTGVLSFAGDTAVAYPIMMQIRQAMSGYTRIETRAMDISDINGHILKHANHLFKSVKYNLDPTLGFQNEFLFGGYSWEDKQFYIWRYYYKAHDKGFVKDGSEKRILSNVNGTIKVIGDKREDYKKVLRELLRNKYGADIDTRTDIALDMEPFEALCLLLRSSGKQDTIGGAPQMIKSYQYMNTRPVGVYWPKKVDTFSNRTILGRKLFEYEDTEYWFIDPDTLITSPCYNLDKGC